jgi:hypothetical protein
MMFYVQCLIHYINGRSFTEIAWLPKQYASYGLKLKLFRNDNWQSNWKVLEVYKNYVVSEKIIESQGWTHIPEENIMEEQ